MAFYLFLLFAVMPIVEIYVLMTVGDALGAINTIALVILTAAVGASLVRSQGLSTMMSVQQRLARGEMPGQQIVEGVMLAVAGVLLVTPGFVTDAFGLLVLTPATRAPIARFLMSKMQLRMVQPGQFQGGFGQTHTYSESQQDSPLEAPRRDIDQGSGGSTIDGDYERKD
ncbi:FxsA family protein [Ferrimonas pelagia]|uniref:FxsA family protein n=1 Tax=Ferrimonas pelagia TaxID=1177826 RepID=A0ABP9ED97_9GAMM